LPTSSSTLSVVLLAEKRTGYRNFKDYVTIDELAEIHREGERDPQHQSRSEKFSHGIKVPMYKNYDDNLSEEVRKLHTKAARVAAVRGLVTEYDGPDGGLSPDRFSDPWRRICSSGSRPVNIRSTALAKKGY
jgi:hypothetical protein